MEKIFAVYKFDTGEYLKLNLNSISNFKLAKRGRVGRGEKWEDGGGGEGGGEGEGGSGGGEGGGDGAGDRGGG